MLPHVLGGWDDSWDNPGGWDSSGAGWGMPAPRRVFPWKVIVAVVLVVTVVVVGVRLVASAAEGPAVAARRYLQAAVSMDGNDLARRTCDAQQEALMGTGLVLTALSMIANYYVGFGLEDVQVDLSDVNYTTVSQAADRAEVRVSGEMRSSILLLSLPVPIDEQWLMVREDGRWKWCGYARPPAVPTFSPP